uniref:Integrase catalytic domain-containing protein n=1 Tax=Tanacetum cinerariifolium TaxID=118510 RepID=A0A6L2MNX5_TANCI|nr:hypothetical protein [Tanacetum cinerariifolium]
MALLSMRADKFWKKTGKKISIQGTDVAGFDKSKVECFNYHKIGHFARECRAPRSQGRGRRENFKQGSKVEESAPKALMAIDEVGWDWSYMANEEENHALVADEEAPIEFALMAKSSSDSEVEARLVEFKNQEIKFREKIRGLEFKVESKTNRIDSLTNELEMLKKEKEGLDSKLIGFQSASKDLENLLGSQRSDKNKEDDTITDYSVILSKNRESNSNDLQNNSTAVSENEESTSSILSKPKINFMKAADSPTVIKTNKDETVRKPSAKYAKMYRKTSKSSNVRGNQRSWNNLKSQQLGKNFLMKNKACFNCGDFDHLFYDCGKRAKKGKSRPKNNTHKSIPPRTVFHKSGRSLTRTTRPNMNAAQPKRTSFYKPAHSYVKRSFQRRSAVRTQFRVLKVPTVSKNFPTVTQKFPTGNSKLSPADLGNKGKAVKALACWIWRPKQNSTVKGPNSNSGNSYNNIDDKGYWNSGCSRHMTGNISYLSDYEPYDGGFVSFGQECIVLGRNFKLKDDTNVLLRTPRQHNMYSIDLNNAVTHKDINCLVAKASADESMLWHRRLGHLNFKTMNRFTWTFFLKTKDETSGILRNFIIEIENLKDFKVKIIRCDNGGEFRNKEMNDFCSRKGIKREFINARTPQQNRVAERRNRTLIEAARTMLANAKLPVTFWDEAVNTACYVQNRVLVDKSQNKSPYELFNGRSPAIGFLKPFGCHVMILNTLYHLGKFEAKEDEGYFIRYSMSSKEFRVFNKRTKKVEEKLHVEFLENKLIKKGAGPNWLFDIDTLTNFMNYVPVVDAGKTSTNFLAHLESSTSNAQDACKADAPESSRNSNPTATSTNPLADQMETLTMKTPIPNVSSHVPTACLDDSLQPSSDTRLILKRVTSQDDTPSLDNILTLSNRFEDILGVTTNTGDTNGVEANLSNMENNISASPTPTFRIHKDHPKSQIIGPVNTLEEPKKIYDALKDPSWVEAMPKELLQFKIQNVWSLVDCPEAVWPIGTKWINNNKKDERGIMIRNKARLVAQGHTQEEGTDYEEVFAPVARIEAIRIFLAYASFIGFIVHQMDVKSAFLYGTIDEEVYVMQPPGFQDPEFPARVYKVEKAMYGLHQAPRALHQVTPKECHLHTVKRIFRYLKGHPKLGIRYPKDSLFDLVAYSDSDYGGATQDRKSTTGGCQFLGRRLISWQCKNQTIVATSTTEAEYVAAASGCGQVL